MKKELTPNVDVLLSRQHQFVELRSQKRAQNRRRFHISSYFVYFWLSAAIISLSSWIIKLWTSSLS